MILNQKRKYAHIELTTLPHQKKNILVYQLKKALDSQKEEEITFINSIKIYDCPYCGGSVNKNGHRKDGLQRYICCDCKRKSNPLTNTIFDSHKIPISEWIEYLLHLFEFHSVKTSAIDNRNSDTTGRYWLFKGR